MPPWCRKLPSEDMTKEEEMADLRPVLHRVRLVQALARIYKPEALEMG